MSRQPKPIIHGRDHAPGGADPIPGLSDLVTAGTLPGLIAAHSGTDLVAWWRMGETTGDMLDYAQNPLGDKPAALTTGAGTPHVSRGATGGLESGDDRACVFQYNQAAVSDGTGDFFSATDTADHRFAFGTLSPFTLECLVKPTSSWTAQQGIFGTVIQAASANEGWGLLGAVGTGGITPELLRCNNAAAALTASSTVAAYGVWSHLAATFDGSTQRVYVNGVQTASASTAVTCASHDTVYLGKTIQNSAGSSVSRCFYGVLDEVAVYDTALTAAEILEHAAAGVSLATPIEAGAFAVYANGA